MSWPDFLDLYLFYRLLEACLHHSYRYQPSFHRIRLYYAQRTDDLIHRVMAYRYFGPGLDLSRKQACYRAIVGELSGR